ncbi:MULTISPECIES: hypothetical protein [Aminobacterium]|jgi:hypothetical protein|uniref:Uncharacterized protein n=1 Tax=Aminobacterium colombiense (strain DSM 12261 / ALA-1) TaxID=572547 RepID=D5EGA7_AMICL|nr:MULTISPECIES: hypothetical protein [Aminobacterium]MDD2379661.1 hypothetical protein [Aminobacterium colombiense]ADE57589.1 hypothetical protein Amico_1472 [Aminobacterium colombiense DSM 12261]MDD3768147.1 hypothetical protein [Aminobacterium colombiense]MDD4265667.1 hypothetical protein [Aminobacterium colombiense]MDD4585865.1 hypothetical protein [Aminobacterium colombiense]
MMKYGKKKLAAVVLAFVISLSGMAWAIDLGDLIGVVGGGFIVSQVAGPLNDFINTVTFNKGAKVEGHTKVVPIVSLGSGTRIGAAQVAGPRGEAIQKTKAVAQLEVTFRDRLRTKILIPIDSENPVKQFKRVQGVGVSAIIDFRL